MYQRQIDNVKEEEEKAVQTSKVSFNGGGVENVKLTVWVFITENARKENSIYLIELQRKGVS